MEFSASFLVLSLLTLTYVYVLFVIFRRRNLPPGPMGFPVIGNLLALGDRPHESLAELAKVHGPLMTLKLGFSTTVVASSADMARQILQKHDQAFLGRPVPDAVTAEKNYHRSVAWISGGPTWRSLRKICNSHVFTPTRLDILQHVRHRMAGAMVRRVAGAAGSGERVSIGKLVFGTTLNLLSNTMFCIDIMDPTSRAVEELKVLIGKIMELAGKPNVSDYFPALKPLDLQRIKREIRVSYDGLHALLDGIIKQRLRERENGCTRYDDFLDVLLDQSQEHQQGGGGGGDQQFNLDDVNILLADLFIGGTDTTTTTMEWAMTELLRNPKIMARAKQELKETIGLGQAIQEKDIPKLPFLESILKETLRLHPTAPFLLPHRAESDVDVCGYTVPKNTQVLVNTWAILRDPSYWDKPTEFVPDRFMSSEIDFRGTNFNFTPFSAGRRLCPGLILGVRMMSLLVGSLIHHFDWKLPDGMHPEDLDVSDKFGVTLQKAIPLVAIPIAV